MVYPSITIVYSPLNLAGTVVHSLYLTSPYAIAYRHNLTIAYSPLTPALPRACYTIALRYSLHPAMVWYPYAMVCYTHLTLRSLPYCIGCIC